jgi:hypothetical protein
MQQSERVVPFRANVDAETQGIIFRDTKIFRSSVVHEGERAARSRVPGICRKHIQNGLQLRHESGRIFSPLAFRVVGVG